MSAASAFTVTWMSLTFGIPGALPAVEGKPSHTLKK